jgi:hypothetical protein
VDIDLTRFGPWYGNAVSDIEDFRASVQRVIELQPKVGISSHLIDPVTEDLDNRLKRYLAIFDERENRILENITNGTDTLEKMTHKPTIYPRIPLPAYLVFEQFMLEKHLELLVRNNKVVEDEGRFSIEKG